MALPLGWVQCSLVEANVVIAGQSPESKYYNETGDGLPFFQGKADFGQLYPTNRVFCTEPKKVAVSGDVLLSVRAPVGPTNLVKDTVAIGRGLNAIRPLGGILTRYVLYYFKQIEPKLSGQGVGTTFSAVTIDDVKNLIFPLPPLAEQHRIVAKIDALFSELDKGVEMLQTTRAQLRTYRQAVLKWAFEGRLSEQWRIGHLSSEKLRSELNNVRLNTIREDVDGSETHLAICDMWQWVSIGDLFRVEVGATPSRKQSSFWNGDIFWVSSGEVKFNRIFVTEESITEDGLQHTSTNVHPIGTVLLAMIGEGKTRGRASILKVPAAHNQNTAAILVRTQLSSEYLYYYLQYNYQNTRRVGSGNNQKALSKERVRMLPFPYTVKEEQDLIVLEIESRLSVCDKLEQLVDENLAKAQALRQSILKKAFAGELVPQDPNDEPAEKLLERIKAMKVAATKTTTARRAHR